MPRGLELVPNLVRRGTELGSSSTLDSTSPCSSMDSEQSEHQVFELDRGEDDTKS